MSKSAKLRKNLLDCMVWPMDWALKVKPRALAMFLFMAAIPISMVIIGLTGPLLLASILMEVWESTEGPKD